MFRVGPGHVTEGMAVGRMRYATRTSVVGACLVALLALPATAFAGPGHDRDTHRDAASGHDAKPPKPSKKANQSSRPPQGGKGAARVDLPDLDDVDPRVVEEVMKHLPGAVEHLRERGLLDTPGHRRKFEAQLEQYVQSASRELAGRDEGEAPNGPGDKDDDKRSDGPGNGKGPSDPPGKDEDHPGKGNGKGPSDPPGQANGRGGDDPTGNADGKDGDEPAQGADRTGDDPDRGDGEDTGDEPADDGTRPSADDVEQDEPTSEPTPAAPEPDTPSNAAAPAGPADPPPPPAAEEAAGESQASAAPAERPSYWSGFEVGRAFGGFVEDVATRVVEFRPSDLGPMTEPVARMVPLLLALLGAFLALQRGIGRGLGHVPMVVTTHRRDVDESD